MSLNFSVKGKESRCLPCSRFFQPNHWMKGTWVDFSNLSTRTRWIWFSPYNFDGRLWTGWPTPSTPWRMTSPPLCSPLDYTTQAGLFYSGRFVANGSIILHQRVDWLLVCIKGKDNNIKILGLSGRPQPWRCRCWQPAMSPISSRSLLLWNLTWLKSWVKFNVGQFQNDWMGRRENNLREKEELWHVEVKDSN